MATHLSPAHWPLPISTNKMTGRIVALEPLREAHAPELAHAGRDPQVWRFTTSRADTPETMREYVVKLLRDWEAGMAVPFAVRSLASGAVVGCTRLKELERAHRRCLLGSWYAPEAWRTGVNLEAKRLLLGFAFETLGCVRVELHTDAGNARSRASLEKLGAKFEGVLRAHRITLDAELRDSAVYSVLADEWPGVRTGIEKRLTRG